MSDTHSHSPARVIGTETEFGIASRDPNATDPVANSIHLIGHYPNLPAPQAVWDAGDAVLPLDPRLPRSWRASIIEALEACAGNQTHAAEMLGISRRTLVTRLTQYDLPRPRRR